jgi:hypothetical protein
MMTPMTLGQYNVQSLEFTKDQARFASADEAIAFIKEQIDAHPMAAYISTFDHYTHTKNLPQSRIADDIVDVKMAIFCFGPDISVPQLAGIRPRSISVVEHTDKFTVTFMNAPAPFIQDAMTDWSLQLKK